MSSWMMLAILHRVAPPCCCHWELSGKLVTEPRPYQNDIATCLITQHRRILHLTAWPKWIRRLLCCHSSLTYLALRNTKSRNAGPVKVHPIFLRRVYPPIVSAPQVTETGTLAKGATPGMIVHHPILMNSLHLLIAQDEIYTLIYDLSKMKRF